MLFGGGVDGMEVEGVKEKKKEKGKKENRSSHF